MGSQASKLKDDSMTEDREFRSLGWSSKSRPFAFLILFLECDGTTPGFKEERFSVSRGAGWSLL